MGDRYITHYSTINSPTQSKWFLCQTNGRNPVVKDLVEHSTNWKHVDCQECLNLKETDNA